MAKEKYSNWKEKYFLTDTSNLMPLLVLASCPECNLGPFQCGVMVKFQHLEYMYWSN